MKKKKQRLTPIEKEIKRREDLIKNLTLDIDVLIKDMNDRVTKIKAKIAGHDQVLQALKKGMKL